MMWVPLFVKAPDQQEGAIDDTNVLTIDVAPTVADLVGVDIPWDVDGRSVLSDPRTDGTKPFVFWQTVDDPDNPDRRIEVDGAAALSEVLGATAVAAPADRGPVPRPYLSGRETDRWVGRPPPADPEDGGGAADLDQQGALDDVVLGRPPVPVYLSGTVEPDGDGFDLVAITVNGTVAAVEPLFSFDGVDGRFAAIVPPGLLVDGANDVRLFGVDDQGGFHQLD
jgi:hypothetical protein